MPLYKNASSPESFVLAITPADGETGINFTGVDTATCLFYVRLPDGTEMTWAAVASGVASGTITLTRVFAADGTDVPQSGPYKVYAIMPLTAGGRYRSKTILVSVYDSFDADGDT